MRQALCTRINGHKFDIRTQIKDKAIIKALHPLRILHSRSQVTVWGKWDFNSIVEQKVVEFTYIKRFHNEFLMYNNC